MKPFFFSLILFPFALSPSFGVEDGDKTPPPPLSVEAFKEYFDEVEKALSSGPSEERERRVNAHIQSIKEERARQYEGSVMRVRSEGTASIGTKLNFREDRREVRFHIDAPIPGLQIKRTIGRPAFKMERGSKKRVKSHAVNQPADGGTKVPFHITLIEPDGIEKDVHISYWAWVDYEFTASAAKTAADADIQPVVEFAQSRIKEEEKIDEAQKAEKANAAGEEAEAKRENEQNFTSEEKQSQGNRITDSAQNVVSSLVAAFLIYIIGKSWRRWGKMGWRKLRGKDR